MKYDLLVKYEICLNLHMAAAFAEDSLSFLYALSQVNFNLLAERYSLDTVAK